MNRDQQIREAYITLRPYRPTDEGLIYSSWLKALRYGNDWFSHIAPVSFFTHYRKVIDSILSRPGIEIRIACLKDEPDVIVGYSIFEKRLALSILHWVFVKHDWRGIGIANQLLPPFDRITHLTKIGRAIKIKKDLIFDPFLI